MTKTIHFLLYDVRYLTFQFVNGICMPISKYISVGKFFIKFQTIIHDWGDKDSYRQIKAQSY